MEVNQLAAAESAAACFYCQRAGRPLEPCCEKHPGDLVCTDHEGCRDYLLAQVSPGGELTARQGDGGRVTAARPVLTAGDLDVLRQALADAVDYRDPSGSCTACDDSPAELCEDHAADLDKTDAYLALAIGLGIEGDR